MTLPLNDGSIVRVEYEGDVAPRISYAPVARLASAPVEYRPELWEDDKQLALFPL